MLMTNLYTVQWYIFLLGYTQENVFYFEVANSWDGLFVGAPLLSYNLPTTKIFPKINRDFVVTRKITFIKQEVVMQVVVMQNKYLSVESPFRI